jgi:hypothetical protein
MNHSTTGVKIDFRPLLDLFKPTLVKKPDSVFQIYTVFQKKEILFRSDACSPYCLGSMQETGQNSLEWFDWAVFSFIGNRGKTEDWPGQIYGFVNLDLDTVRRIKRDTKDSGCIIPEDRQGKQGKDVTSYAIVRFTKDCLHGFFDPKKKPLHDETGRDEDIFQEMQSNSRFLFWSEREDAMHLVPTYTISHPIVALVDFCPKFKKMGRVTLPQLDGEWHNTYSYLNGLRSFIFVRPRNMWAQVVVEIAKDEYSRRNDKMQD